MNLASSIANIIARNNVAILSFCSSLIHKTAAVIERPITTFLHHLDARSPGVLKAFYNLDDHHDVKVHYDYKASKGIPTPGRYQNMVISRIQNMVFVSYPTALPQDLLTWLSLDRLQQFQRPSCVPDHRLIHLCHWRVEDADRRMPSYDLRQGQLRHTLLHGAQSGHAQREDRGEDGRAAVCEQDLGGEGRSRS
jgi:hypothetical protein